MSDKSKRGSAAECRVASYFLEHDYEVYRPVSEGGSVDLLVVSPVDDRPIRVQVKHVYERAVDYGVYYTICLPRESDVRRGKRGSVYTRDSFDLLAASHPDGALWLIPVEKILGKATIHLERINEKLRPGGSKKTDWSSYRVR